jgi:hypothetical protein
MHRRGRLAPSAEKQNLRVPRAAGACRPAWRQTPKPCIGPSRHSKNNTSVGSSLFVVPFPPFAPVLLLSTLEFCVPRALGNKARYGGREMCATRSSVHALRNPASLNRSALPKCPTIRGPRRNNDASLAKLASCFIERKDTTSRSRLRGEERRASNARTASFRRKDRTICRRPSR